MNENTGQKAPPITINLMNPKIKVTPGNRRAKPGEEIPVNIVPPQERGTVSTLAKADNPDNPGPDNWLTERNLESDSMMTITVPDHAYFDEHCPGSPGTECQFAYGVEAPEKAPGDPMITVRR
jgi:hypothetical protein